MSKLEAGEMYVGALAREAGVTTATINFYVTAGVLPPPRKLSRTRAAYNDLHRRALKLIRTMQAQGYSLDMIRRAFRYFGTDEEGVQKLEGIGYLQPLLPPPGSRHRTPIEHFDPVDRERFLELAGSEELLEALERWGVLRPSQAGRYDARDLLLVRCVESLLDAGAELPQLEPLAGLIAPIGQLSFALMRMVQASLPSLRSRELKFRELYAPFHSIFAYLSNRVFEEQHPDWRRQLYASTSVEAPPDRVD